MFQIFYTVLTTKKVIMMMMMIIKVMLIECSSSNLCDYDEIRLREDLFYVVVVAKLFPFIKLSFNN